MVDFLCITIRVHPKGMLVVGYLASLLLWYLTNSNGHSTQRLKLRILIKARLQTAPKFLRIKSIFDRISTHDNPQPLCICLCCTSLRTGNRPNNCTSSEIRDGHTLFKTGERGRGSVSFDIPREWKGVKASLVSRARHTSDFLTEAKKEGEWFPHS